MDNFDQDYLTEYRLFFDDLYRSFETDNPLPVHIGKYKVAEFEIAGEVTCWCLEYLNNRNCPPSLIAPLCRGVLAEMEDCIRTVPESCGYRPEEDDFMTLKLMQMTIQKLHEVCLRYRDNSEVSKLPPPPPVPPSVSSAAIKNGNRTMEDCHIIIHDLHALFGIEGYGVASYYAVFDGHVGFDAALYSCAHIYQYLVESSYYPTNPEAAFMEAFLKTEERFINKSNKENLKSGTTAVCILIRHDRGKAYVAWLGDSQAMIVNGRDYIQFVNPHHPEQREEKERIESLGGTVMFWGTWRVNGQLAVSRAIGDVDYKPYVIAEPDITSYDLTGDEDFLLIACDGFWDVICEKNAVEEVYKCLEEHKGDRSRVSQCLVQAAKSLGSRDNITVVVAWLDMSTLENGHFAPDTEVDSADDLLLPPVLRSIKPAAQSIMAGDESGELGGEGESGDDSDEEWNYISGKENREPNQHNKQELTREEMESQLNPNAAEFIPVYSNESPTADITDITRSPRKRSEMKNLDNVLIPSETDFLTDISGRPSDVDGLDLSTTLNGGDMTDLSTKAVYGDDSVLLTSLNTSFLQSDSLKSTNPFASPEVPNFVQDHFSEAGLVSKPLSDVKSDSEFDFLSGDDVKPNAMSESIVENADVSGLYFGVSVDDFVRSKQDSPLLRESPELGLPNGQTAIESSSPDFERISPTELTPAQNRSITPDVAKEESITVESQSATNNLASENLACFDYDTEKMLGVETNELEHGPETSVDSDSEKSIPIARSTASDDAFNPGLDEEVELEDKEVLHKDEEDIDFVCSIKTGARSDETNVEPLINEVENVMNDYLCKMKDDSDDLICPVKVDTKVANDDVCSRTVDSLVDANVCSTTVDEDVCSFNAETKLAHDDIVCPIKSEDTVSDNVPNSTNIDDHIIPKICICPRKLDDIDSEVVCEIEKQDETLCPITRDDLDLVSPIKSDFETVDNASDFVLETKIIDDLVVNAKANDDCMSSFERDVERVDDIKSADETVEDDLVCSFKRDLKVYDEVANEISSEDVEEDSSFEKLQQIPSDFEIVPHSEILPEKCVEEELPYTEKSNEVISEAILSSSELVEESSKYEINDLTSAHIYDHTEVGKQIILNSSEVITQSEISVDVPNDSDKELPIVHSIEKEEEAEQILSAKEVNGTEEKELISPLENEENAVCSLRKEEFSEFVLEKVTNQLEDLSLGTVTCLLKPENDFTYEKEDEKETEEEKPLPDVCINEDISNGIENLKEQQVEDIVCSNSRESSIDQHEDVGIEVEKPLVEQIKSQFIIETEHESIINLVEESVDVQKSENESKIKHEEVVDEMSSSMIDYGEDKLLPEPQLNQLDLVQELQFEVQEKTEADTESDSGFEIINASEASTIEMEMRIQSEKEAGAADEKLHLDQNEAELQESVKEESPVETTQVESSESKYIPPLDLTKVELIENKVLLNGGTVTPPATPPATPAPDVKADSIENKEGLIAAAVAAAGVATAVVAGTATVAVADPKKVEEKKKAAPLKKTESISKTTTAAKSTATKPATKPTALSKTAAAKPIGASKTTAKPSSPATKPAPATSKTTTASSKPNTPTMKSTAKTTTKPPTPIGSKPSTATTTAKPKPIGSSAPIKSTASSVSAKPSTTTAVKKAAPATSVSKPTSAATKPAAPSAKPLAKTTASTVGAAKPAAAKPAPAKVSPVKAPAGTMKPSTTTARPLSGKSTVASKAPTSTASKAAVPAKSTAAPLKAPAKPAGTKPPAPITKTTTTKPVPTKAAVPAKAAPAPLNKKAAAPTAIKKPAAPIEKSVKEANNKLASAKTAVKKTDEKKIISKKDEVRETEVPLTQEPIITTTNGHLSLIENGIAGSEIVADTN